MKVVFYGRLAEVIGPEINVSASGGCSVSALRDRLAAEHPAAEATLRSKRARACVGDTMVPDNHILVEADTVEFLPPVSGG